MSDKTEYEIEIFPGCWIDADPDHLFDTSFKSLTDYGDINDALLEKALWWMDDLTEAPRYVRKK
ncbi:MAG: hypothetical protein PHP23_07840 [Desulfobacterales bacterium]|nr:hypothetical protein [Desulfobacterales bacterium]MDD4073896.1 hypothetical protein [Desulfobacterales bacterium]MDD4393695.1 hypothetical protein [Desulfobacterales bacterium]